ncbi:MAG: HAD-IIA family hydrolase [Candidatus Nanopelagicales bacterium]|jgi:HAD superfamily hydrolase (TIGR01450 family)|nr:HAD-IIA family hydrolase [Candidatus Nanopelagicales bacterium]MCU0295201.1 HAD-IIA family hydrolase [Candidatus Nanopelagicales bacterium]MCU0298514.1 HAD-IIA family hydrolase [Candidatus Nanopelagicales bacterium]
MTYDGLFVDLDGVVYRSEHAVPHAVEALSGYPGRVVFVTNNASRTPQTVASQLMALGLSVSADDVVTSAQAAAAHLTTMVGVGARVLVVGADGLLEAIQECGFQVVDHADDADAVVQGFSPAITWADLAEASYAVARGIPWVASNTDMSVPTARGIAPGTGTFVAAVTAATSVQPVVTGKPHRPIMELARARSHSLNPLVVGDRLDTDIAAANAAGMDSLLVLTGVSRWQDLLAAPAEQLPTKVAPDLRVLDGHTDEMTRALQDLVDGLRAGRDVGPVVDVLHQLPQA